ncbi:MAG: tetratricopeptide repeat protein [Hyphomicrobiaceae bacterium]
MPIPMKLCRAALMALICGVTVPAVLQSTAAEPPRKRPPLHGQAVPDNPEDRVKLLDNLYALLATAENEQAAGEIAAAIERLWIASSGSDTVAVLMERALKAANEKKLDMALQFLDSIVDLAPDYAEGWNRRAYVFYMQHDMVRALGDLRRTLALDPSHFKALEGLGQMLREIGEKKAALAAYKRLVEVHPLASGAQKTLDELERDVSGQGI